MPSEKCIITRSAFQFLRDLSRHNRREWMEKNRERYQHDLVQPFRRLHDALAPIVLQFDSRFDTSCRTGANFSRINRDIRFARDKTLYKTHMYLKFSVAAPDGGETGQLYTGVSINTVTAGFRIYSGAKRKDSTIALIAEPRVLANPHWPGQQKKRLARRYESYWYGTVRGEWTQHPGWPTTAEDWKKLRAWIVRRKLSPTAATRGTFPGEVSRIFRDLFPLLRFTSIPD
jgi:uncharacterized protein (TIGR02453 family)